MEPPRILVIDDDMHCRCVLSEGIRQMGHTCFEAADGPTGLAMARRENIDVILCDVFMPATDGYQVLSVLKEDHATASIPVILITGNEEIAGLRRSMDAGADDFLPKPFNMQELQSAIAAQVKKKERLREREQETEARLLEIINATTDLIALADPNTYKITYINRSGWSMLHLNQDHPPETLTLSALYPPDQQKFMLETAVPDAMEKGAWHGESTFLRQDGSELKISQVILAHRGLSGHVEYLSTIARDITSLKNAEKERMMMELQLRQAQKLESIGQLAAGIAHEINTPTQYIGDNIRFLKESFAELEKLTHSGRRLLELAQSRSLGLQDIEASAKLEGEIDSDFLLEEIPHAITQAEEGVERVTKIVQAMKEFSHPASNEKMLLDINKAIESTLTVSRNEWKYHAELITEFDPALPPLPCLPDEFNQVILNLVVNGTHAIIDRCKQENLDKGQLSVVTLWKDSFAEIRISDTGTGIPEKIRDKIFDPFFTSKPIGKGTGQGLAIARSVIVNKHGGSVTFETETGKGTTFIIHLPVNSASQQKPHDQHLGTYLVR